VLTVTPGTSFSHAGRYVSAHRFVYLSNTLMSSLESSRSCSRRTSIDGRLPVGHQEASSWAISVQ
jgi:hypothetical protein